MSFATYGCCHPCYILYNSIFSSKGKQTSPKHRVGSPIGKLFNFSIESSYEEKEEEIFLNMEKENIPIIPTVKLCFEDSNSDIFTTNGNPKIHHTEKSTESTIGKDNSVELIEFNSLDYSTKINTSNHANNSNEPKMNGNYVNDTKVEPDSCDTSFQQPFQTIDTLNETKHYSKIDENTLENGFHTPKENHDNFSVVDETKPDSKVETNGHKYDNNDENSEDNHEKSIDTPEQSIDDNCDTNCTNIETALIMQRKKTAEARRNFFRESKNLHENGLNMME